MEITDQEMHGASIEIPKEEAYNLYCDSARRAEIQALGEHGAFIIIPQRRGQNEMCV